MTHALFVSGMLLANVWLIPAHGPVEYDPIGLAMERLEQKGFPPPAGTTIRPARKGELEKGVMAETNEDGTDIAVDLTKLEKVAGEESGTEEFLDLVESVLRHEYGHTSTYGTPSNPPSGGFNRDVCSHQALYGQTADETCELIEERQQSGGNTEGLCRFNRWMVEQHNSASCMPPPPKKFPCDACA